MVIGIICLAIFHFSKINSEMRGWHLWIFLFEFLRDAEIFDNVEGLLGFSGFITLSFTTFASPLLFGWICRNAWIKWCLVVFSVMAAGTMWYFVFSEGAERMDLLATAPTFTLIGLLCVKATPQHLPPPSSI